LREVWLAEGNSEWGVATFVAERLKKVGGGFVGVPAVSKLFKKIDADAAWFPGKSSQEKFGPSRALSAQARQAIARSAMAMAARKEEPTFAKVAGACPMAILNPATKKPVDKKRVYEVFRNECYDTSPDEPWKHQARLSKVALTDSMIQKRYQFGLDVQALGRSPQWFYQKLAWVDLCNSVLPRSEKKASEQALARKAGKGWISGDSKLFSQNLAGNKAAYKQKSWDTIRVWWVPVLAQGKLHIEVFDADFPGETEAGATIMVSRVRSALNVRFRTNQPTILYVDRGKGFYNPGTGRITAGFRQGLRDHGLKAFWGEDASTQPGNLQELMLHETAVSWVRRRLTESTPASAASETRETYVTRLKQVCADINASLDVEGLSRAFPARVRALLEAKGDRITK
jgi:hypothetical protein